MDIFPRSGVKGFPTLFLFSAVLLFAAIGNVGAEMASVYGGSDGLCGSRTANGERLNCAAMTAAHRTSAFGTLVQVCQKTNDALTRLAESGVNEHAQAAE
jgi:rare lipoprotein A (peptidoglycan hydrolase)